MHTRNLITKRSLYALVVASVALLFCLSAWGKAWDSFCYDMFFNLRGANSAPAEIVIVAIDEPSFGALQLQWPWPRSLHAKLIERLFEAGAKTVALDILFAEPSIEIEDQSLVGAIAKRQEIVLAADYETIIERNTERGILVEPLPALVAAGAKLGVVRYPLESDGFLRRAHSRISSFPSFAYRAASEFTEDVHSLENYPSEFAIDFTGPPRSVTTVSYYQALDPERYLKKDFFKDKLIFIGLDSKSEVGLTVGRDRYSYPFTRGGAGSISGVEVHANAAATLLSGSAIHRLPQQATVALSLLLATLCGTLFFSLAPLRGGLIFLCLVLPLTILDFLLFKHFRIYLSPILILFPILGTYLVSPFIHYVQAWREKIYIRRTFSTYLAPRLVNKLLESPDKLELGGEIAQATVLFADIVGFTTFSEKLPPKVLVEFLNRCLGELGEPVLNNNGMIDKYIGDCIMAVWGVPLADSAHARNACQAICEMLIAAKRLSTSELVPTGVKLRIRIGASSGDVIAGNVGGGNHRNYTVIGNNVNLASRLEHVNELYGTTAIIDETTAQLVSSEFDLRELDTIAVKGQEQSLKIFELVGRSGELSSSQQMINQLFAEALTIYQNRDWLAAKAAFDKAIQLAPGDGPSKLMSARCQRFFSHPPPAEWDGVFRIDTK